MSKSVLDITGPDPELKGSGFFHAGRDDRKAGLPVSANPFVAHVNREMWQMGWEYEDQLIKEQEGGK